VTQWVSGSCVWLGNKKDNWILDSGIWSRSIVVSRLFKHQIIGMDEIRYSIGFLGALKWMLLGKGIVHWGLWFIGGWLFG